MQEMTILVMTMLVMTMLVMLMVTMTGAARRRPTAGPIVATVRGRGQ